MRKAIVALLLLVGAAAFATNGALASTDDNMAPKLQNAGLAKELRTRAAKLQTSATTVDTTWVGYTPGKFNASNNWYSLGSGSDKFSTPTGPYNRPPAQGSIWDFEPTAGVYLNGDSAMGWTPYREDMTGTGGLTLPDVQRPWRAIDYGNGSNYAPGIINGRTSNMFGVVGVWHVDVGNTGAGAGKGVAWSPLAGTSSAWMGLRRHGDHTSTDATTRGGTGNSFNEDALMFGKGGNTVGSVASTGSDKKFPGYGGRMDQMLYRDIDGSTATSLSIRFRYRTDMSTGFGTNPITQTGWFQHDPLTISTGLPAPPPASLNAANPNFIRSDPGAGAPSPPADSLMLYIGAPAEGTVQLSDGNTWPIGDPKRRWFGEVIRSNENLYDELFTVGGANAATQTTVTADPAVLTAVKAASGGKVRIVFRVKTNWQFDDETFGFQGFASSGGAAVIDDVEYSINGGAFTLLGNFEAASAIDNTVPVNPLSAADPRSATNVWKSTGKGPKIYSHIHPLNGRAGGYDPLDYDDLCGQPGNPARICDMQGVVWSIGNHDDSESSGGELTTSEQEPFDGIISPAIQIGGGIGSRNAIGLNEAEADPSDDYYLLYELYAGRFDFFNEGSAWWFGCMAFPTNGGATDPNPRWGEIRHPGFIFFNPDRQCFADIEGLFANGILRYVTSAAAGGSPRNQTLGLPDSLRLTLMARQEAYRFSIPNSKFFGGAYYDNVSLGIVDGAGGDPVSIDIWQLIHDTFPQSENNALAGNPFAFDTTTALVKTGINIAPTTANLLRFDVPGDTVAVIAEGTDVRLDMVFRILPGPGNYVTPGQGQTSQIRAVPTAAAPRPNPVSGVANFWSNYMFNNGAKGSPGGHPTAVGGPLAGQKVWSPQVWNSARCDTAEVNVFNLQKRGVIQPATSGLFMTAYHENELADANRGALGIARNICFVTDSSIAGTARPTSEVLCGSGNVPAPPFDAYPPVWVTAPGSGYNGVVTTKEGTKIIPDGQLTPGSHVEYFFRREDTGVFIYNCPDTNIVTPQTCEGSTDGHRWQEFSVLPDRWKDASFTHPVLGLDATLNPACVLYVDQHDRRNNERIWMGVADSIGAQAANKKGAHNGWSASGETGADINDPTFFVRRHIGQAGSSFDMYGVKASESLNTGTGSIGSRESREDGANPQINGKISRQGPTQTMLNTYYDIILTFTGDLNSSVYGPFSNKSQNDILVMQNFLLSGTGVSPITCDRGFWAGGDGFAEALAFSGSAAISGFLTGYLGANLLDENYLRASGNTKFSADVFPTSEIDPGLKDIYGLRNACTFTLDVVENNPGLATTAVAAYYEAISPDPANSWPAAVVKKFDVSKPWVALTEGWNINVFRSRNEISSRGRLAYYYNAANVVFGAICGVAGTPATTTDTPTNNDGRVFNAFSLANNPVRVAGTARLNLSLAQNDIVDVKVFDVSGREVRTLFSGFMKAGPNPLTWDGMDNQGKRVARGVYFTQVKFRNSKFADAKKLIVLN